MKLCDLNQRVIVPVVDETRGGIQYEMQMSIGELLGKALEDFEPEIIEAVPVVRCRNCIAWEIDWRPNHSKDDEHFCPMISLVTSGEWFCAYGERRDGEART